MNYFVERLGDHHRIQGFASGRPELDQWFHRYARSNDARYGTTAVWVLCDDGVGGGKVPLGYFTLSSHAVYFTDVTELGFPQSGQWPDPVPATLLGRLAISKDVRGQELATRLLRSAVDTVLLMQKSVATVLLVVDALDESVVAFYERLGFRRLPGSLRLAARIKDLSENLPSP